MTLTRDREVVGRLVGASALAALFAGGCDARIGEAGRGQADAAFDLAPDGATGGARDAGDTGTSNPDAGGGEDAAPSAALPPLAAFAVWPAAGTQATEFSFDASGSRDLDGGGLELAWDWDGDGAFDDQGEVATHAFASDGLHAVTLRARSSAGLASYVSGTVLVAPASEIITVTTPADVADPDDGETSLREAIAQANVTGPHVIAFAEPMTITLATALPAITDDATSIVGGEGVAIDGDGQVADCLTFTSGLNRVMWLEVYGCGDDGLDFASEPGNAIAHCRIHDAGDDGIDLAGGSDHLIGPGNVLFANANAGVEIASDATTIRDNHVYSHLGPGIELLAGTAEPLLIGNVIRHNASGILVDDAISAIDLHHNTVAANRGDGLIIEASDSALHDVQNNLFTHNDGLGIRNGGAFAALDHNGYFENAGGACDACPEEPSSQLLDPQYIDELAGDFRLAPGAPYIDAGKDLGHDVNGPAPGSFSGTAPDVGAAEFP